MSVVESKRAKAIDAVKAAIDAAGFGFGFTGESRRELADEVVDAITEHVIETMRDLLSAEKNLEGDRG